MKRSLLAVAILPLLVAAADSPSTKPVPIRATDKEALAEAQGKEAVVEGRVAQAVWSSSGKVMNIRFEGADESGFVAVVFQRSRAAFDKAFEGDAAKTLTGAKVSVSGKVGTYRDKPQIVCEKPSQITIAKEDSTTEPAK
jgi:DNA/RNA endonuclease YhcR with UshA esterase domain